MKTETATVTRLNWSTLRYLAVSPKLLKWRTTHPESDTPALRLGRAIHCAILEPSDFGKRWVVAGQCAATTKAGSQCASQGSLMWSGAWYCRIKGHAPEGSFGVEKDVEILERDQSALVESCAASVAGHRRAARMLTGGLAEHGIEWTHQETGIACRGRMDYLRPREVVDLKSTAEETTRGFIRAVTSRLYYAQLAWYHDGAIQAGKLQADAALPAIVSVQTVEPYDVAVYRLSKETYEAGQILYRDLLLKYRDCMAADCWPGIADGEVTLELPKWASGMNGSDYEVGGW